MDLTHAVIGFDVATLAVLAADFVATSRTGPAILPRRPARLLSALLVVLVYLVTGQRAQFAAIGGLVLAGALFGYANFLAFVTRGITFSILLNHAQPAGQRRRDVEFVALDRRVAEMQHHGWVEHGSGGWRLTRLGHHIVRVRRTALRLLGARAVG